MSGEDQQYFSVVDAGPDWMDYSRTELSAGWPELEQLTGTVNTKAGVRLTNNNALSYSPVAQAVTMISGSVARLPLHLYRRTSDGGILPAYDQPSYRCLAFEPVKGLNAVKFWRRLMTQVLIWGAGYAWISRDARGNAVAATPLLSDRTFPDDSRPGWYMTEVNESIYWVPERDMLAFEWITLDNECPIDPVIQARETWAAGLAAINFTSRFFGRGGRVGGILELPAGLQPKSRDTVEQGFRESYEGPDAAFRTVILREGAKFHAAQSTLEQAQMVAGRKEAVRDVARFFNLKPSRLGEDSGGGYGSTAEDNRDYLDTTLAPYLSMITAELAIKTLRAQDAWPASPSDPRLYWEHDTNAMLALNMLERYQAYQIGITGTWLSPNEVRRRESMNPRSGGDTYGNPNTSSPGTAAASPASGENRAIKALAELVAATVRDVAAVQVQRVARKIGDTHAFEATVVADYSDRCSRFDTHCRTVCEAWMAATGHDIARNVGNLYYSAVESRLAWIVNNVPAASLAIEFQTHMDAALADLAARIQTITTGQQGADHASAVN